MRHSNKSFNASSSRSGRKYSSKNKYGKNSSDRNFSNKIRHSSRPKRKQASFDPSLLVKKAVFGEKKEYIAKYKFNDFEITDEIKKNIAKKGFKSPSPIQDQIIPQILKGRDVIGLASTGTGKTAAFLIPLINKVFKNPMEKVLIMAPTRELALQIRAEFASFAENLDLKSTLCIGGANIKHQINSLNRDPDFVIGTPGRLIDFKKKNKLNLNSLKTFF